MRKLPKYLQPILWSVGIDKLDPEKNKVYIIHQILAYGRMEDISWLFQNYSLEEIRQVFLAAPSKNYRPARFHFVRNFLLSLENASVKENQYVTNTLRDIRS